MPASSRARASATSGPDPGRSGHVCDRGGRALPQSRKQYSAGTCDGPDVCVCEVPEGLVHAGTGIVLTAEGTIVEEAVLKYRLPFTTVYGGLRPLRCVDDPGVVATILTVFGDNLWHWLVDSIPRLVSLRRALPPGERVTLVVPHHLHPAERDVLQALLPPNFVLKVVSKRTWIRGDRVFLASFLTGRSNGFLPADWLGEIRSGVFEAFGLRENGPPRERIWVSRAGDRHRRVRNEDAVMAALAPLGFRPSTSPACRRRNRSRRSAPPRSSPGRTARASRGCFSSRIPSSSSIRPRPEHALRHADVVPRTEAPLSRTMPPTSTRLRRGTSTRRPA